MYVLEMMYNSPCSCCELKCVVNYLAVLHFTGVHYIGFAQTVSGTRNCPNSLVALFQSGNIPHRLRSPRIYIYTGVAPESYMLSGGAVMFSVGRGVIDGRLYIG